MIVSTQKILKLTLIYTISVLTLFEPAFAQGDTSSPFKAITDLSVADQEIISDLKQILADLKAADRSSYGVMLPKINSSDKVFELMDKASRLVQKADGPEVPKYSLLSKIYLDGVYMLYRTRGESTKNAKDGWMLSRNDELVQQILTFIDLGLLDQEAKDALKNRINAFVFTAESNVISAGFPPQFTIIEQSQKDAILSKIDNSPTARDYDYGSSEIDDSSATVAELTAKYFPDPDAAMAVMGFFDGSENNFYDRAVNVLRDDTKEFPDYFGRDDETETTLQTMMKLEKSHVIFTGKAGVGKTTIIKMLQNGFLSGDYQINENELPPIFLELPITAVTNPSDPSAIINNLKMAGLVSKKFGRRIVLFVDEAHISTKMTRNAIKGFLTEAFDGEENPGVHLMFATTSNEAKDFLGDSAFIRRWVNVHVREFDTNEVIDLIKKTHLRRWQKTHRRDGVGFQDLTEDAYLFAAKYGKMEQPHAANPTGAKELIEAAIIMKLRTIQKEGDGALKNFSIDVQDLREYLKSKLDVPLIPGDPDFDETFARLWEDFELKYKGNEGLKSIIKSTMKKHFASLDPRKMTAALNAGPPGAGKSYLAETLSDVFFGGALLTLYGADYKNGGLELNKLIGSPPGTVGSEEQRSVLTQFFAENPNGGVIVLEEGDYVHQDVFQFFTNMITDKEMKDGLGQAWQTGKYMIMINTNQGQELMIPKGVGNKMTWEDYEIRRQAVTETRVLSDGSEVEVVKSDILDKVGQDFFEQIVTQSVTSGEDIDTDQELQKQRRRYDFWYTLLPTREDLLEAAKYKLNKFKSDAEFDYGVRFEIDKSIIEELIDIEKFQFEKGYSYVDEQMEARLHDKLYGYYHLTGETIKVSLEPTTIEIDGKEQPTQKLVVKTSEGTDEYKLDLTRSNKANPWGSSKEMRKRIKYFARTMRESLVGHEQSIREVAERLKLKSVVWSTPIVVTKIGTTGNGKTEYFKSMAKSLFGSVDDMFTITGLDHPYDLSDYFRPPTGISGSNKETEFEKWFLSRKHRGGVILFDELLSLSESRKTVDGNSAGKVDVLNELYQLLDEGKLQLGSKIYDASNFVIGITGNALQEAFANIPDDPSSAKLIEKIKKKLTKQEIVKYFKTKGIDAPKIARLGLIYPEGPLPVENAQLVGDMKINSLLTELKSQFDDEIELIVPEEITEKIVNELTTLELGMRPVNEGLRMLINAPAAAILFDFPDTKKIEAKLIKGQIEWFADNQPVEKVKDEYGDFVWDLVSDIEDEEIVTPQFSDLEKPEKLLFTEEALKVVKVHELEGHWMTNVLLTGENQNSDISLIPGDGYLGYVRHKERKEQDLSGLSSLFNQIIMLQAGHRAVIKIMGVYETGGGNGDLTKKLTDRNDDVSKIIRNTNAIISNQLIAGMSETTDKKTQENFRNLMSEITISMADFIIMKGYESKAFEPLSDRLMEERYLGEKALDEFVEGLDYTEIADNKYVLFLEALVSAVEEKVEKGSISRSDKGFLNTIVNNLFEEVSSIAKLKEGEKANSILKGIGRIRTDIDILIEKSSSSVHQCFEILSAG